MSATWSQRVHACKWLFAYPQFRSEAYRFCQKLIVRSYLQGKQVGRVVDLSQIHDVCTLVDLNGARRRQGSSFERDVDVNGDDDDKCFDMIQFWKLYMEMTAVSTSLTLTTLCLY